MKPSRWLPAVIAPVVVAGAIAVPVVANAQASASSTDTPTAAQVLASVANAKKAAYSGKLVQTSDLGLPSLPSSSPTSGSSIESGASNVLDLLTTSHSLRIYADGSDKARVQVLGQLAEQDAIVNGRNIWTWDSKTSEAVHYVLPAGKEADKTPMATTPTEIAQKAIAAISSTTTVSKPTSTTVAGRSAWTVTLTPKSSETLVSKVTLSVDRSTGLPLAAAIDAKGQSDPAISVKFSSISFQTPSASLFTFTPPAGAKVTTKDLSKKGPHHKHPAPSAQKHPDNVQPGQVKGSYPPGAASKRPTVTGSGWDQIVQLPADSLGKAGAANSKNAESQNLLNELTKQVTGGRAIQTSLISVFITNDGRVFAGAVPVSALQAAAG